MAIPSGCWSSAAAPPSRSTSQRRSSVLGYLLIVHAGAFDAIWRFGLAKRGSSARMTIPRLAAAVALPLALIPFASAQQYTISTYAGVALGDAWSVAVDSAGNLYIADYSNQRIPKVTPSGIISTVAGNGTPGYSGDGGPATSAQLHFPTGATVDSAGNLYIADWGNYSIRKVTPSGIISTVAGNGTGGYSGDGGPATNAQLLLPNDVAVDNAANLYIADYSNQRIRKVTPSGIISTVAGNGTPGYSGDGGPATSAQIGNPTRVTLDSAGNLYIADSLNSRIRRVNPAGNISTVAGGGPSYPGDGGPATGAGLRQATGVAVDSSGSLYIAETNRIRKVSPAGIISTVAGDGIAGYSGDGGPAIGGELNFATGLTVDSVGNVYVADAGNRVIRLLQPTPAVTYFFPQIAIGNGFQTILTYINFSPVSVTCTTSFASDSGAPLAVPFPSPTGTVFSRTDTMPPGQSLHVQTSASATASGPSGWAQGVCTSPVQASVLYRLFQSGSAVGEAGVNGSTVAATKFATFAETSTGVALGNPSVTQSASVTLTVISNAGTKLGTGTAILPPGGHKAVNLGPFLGITSFTGYVQISSDLPIFSLSLNAEAFPVFSSLPPGDLPPSTQFAVP